MNRKLPCYIVSDLLPLYQEDLVSEQTKKDIDKHLKECDECKKKIDVMKRDLNISVPEPELVMNPLKNLKYYQNTLIVFGAILSFLFGIFSPIVVVGIKILLYGEQSSYHIERLKELGYLWLLENCLIGIGACTVYLLIIFVFKKIMGNNSSGSVLKKILFYGCAAVYLVIIFFIFFHKLGNNYLRAVNLRPFKVILCNFNTNGSFIHDFIIYSILGNIVLFVPMGIYLSLFIKKFNVWKNTMYVGIISIAVEILQYVLSAGATDIDDVILNTIGGLIGVVIYKKIHSIYKDKTKDVITFFAPIGAGIVFVVFGMCQFI